ncbi:hypothetical protein [Agriterribacter sp.]|uniref:hypothetical protein n=1 Tax=Agriterribacter sp. TaxID=2821509 RepID=UPI002C7001F1|nr:hypothetical protein [Agriterribacter sp.]HTN08850.1 hypothetical protein [Agriterribacter sp.]
MENPFDIIIAKLEALESALEAMKQPVSVDVATEIIDRETLCSRLGISLPTAIRYSKRKVIPVIHIGTTIRYNWQAVLKALEKQKPH